LLEGRYNINAATLILKLIAGNWRLTPVILATQEAEIRRIELQRQSRQKIYLQKKKKNHKTGLVEWLKV
jgi:hypothetical protein